MFKTVAVHIQGKAPLFMHNGQLADPLNEHAKLLKELTGKKTKSDSDHAAIAMAEWRGSLYVNEAGHPCIPGDNIDKAIYDAAKTIKLGKVIKSSVMCEGTWPLIYDGPKDINKLNA